MPEIKSESMEGQKMTTSESLHMMLEKHIELLTAEKRATPEELGKMYLRLLLSASYLVGIIEGSGILDRNGKIGKYIDY